MQGVHFRITESSKGWLWRTLDPNGVQLDGGSAAGRAEAAAMVIRSIVRAETGDPNPSPRLAMAKAA